MRKANIIFFAVFLSTIICACSFAEQKQLTISDFESKLESTGMKLGKKSEKEYRMLQAVDGYAIEIEGSRIEIYQFDTSIESGESALNRWKEEGIVGLKPVVNRNLMIFSPKKHPKWKEIKSIFMSI